MTAHWTRAPGVAGPGNGAPAGRAALVDGRAPTPEPAFIADGGGPGSPWAGPVSDAVPVAAPVAGALCILTGTTALPSTVVGSSWVLPLVEVVVVIVLIGLGCRMIRTPPVVTVLVQAGAAAVALTSLFTATGLGGVLPTASAYREARTLLGGAWEQIRTTIPPAPSTPELAFLIAVSVGLAALIVDFLVAEAKAPALVALPLLCLYSVPASIAGELLPWYAFAAPAACYALLLAVAGHRGRRTGARARVGMAGQGIVIGALAIVIALLAADSVTSVGTTGRLPRSNVQGGSVGLSPFTTLRGNLLKAAPVEVLRIKGLPTPDYLRTVALTTWNPGRGWSLGNLRADASDINGPLPGGRPAPDDATVTVISTAFRDRFLPLFGGTDSVVGLAPAWEYDVALETAHRADPVNPGTYRVQVATVKPTEDDLAQDTVTPGGTLTATGDLPARVSQLAQQVTAKADTAFGKALALQKWFTDPLNGFRYSLTVPAGNSGDALVDFLTNKQGYCEQYATAMAVMLRALGIPARVAIGFTQGSQQPDGTYLVTSNDAHSWVEVAFDQNGWVRFDPTPLVDGQGGQQGFDLVGPAITGASTTPSSAVTTAPATGRTANPDGERTRTAIRPVDTTSVAAPASGASAGLVALLVVLALLVAVLLVLVGPSSLRAGRRRRRLERAEAGGPGAATAAWAEIEDTGIDHGIVPLPTESARATANRLARRAHLGDRDRELLRLAVRAVEREWYAPAHGDEDAAARAGAPTGAATRSVAAVLDRPASTTDLAGAVRAVRVGLARQQPLRRADRWLPRSLRRR